MVDTVITDFFWSVIFTNFGLGIFSYFSYKKNKMLPVILKNVRYMTDTKYIPVDTKVSPTYNNNIRYMKKLERK